MLPAYTPRQPTGYPRAVQTREHLPAPPRLSPACLPTASPPPPPHRTSGCHKIAVNTTMQAAALVPAKIAQPIHMIILSLSLGFATSNWYRVAFGKSAARSSTHGSRILGAFL